ncbi:ABC transporter ATP-binding protein [Hirschia maritima]|uniref:ABC transporter ATP-binding protein n=1 Tax=Hirschia maritima TaxID=1121961 RepID=UPI0003793228|nr:ABC transporter ATP-binding protein [Hirschia maritima]
MSSQTSYVVVEDLSHAYSGSNSPALSGINIAIPKGACYGLLGPNGAGKSTLISLLTGMIKIQSGSISIDAQNVDINGHTLKSISAIAPQDLAFYPRLTVKENLNFFAGSYNLTKQTTTENKDFAVQVCDLDAFMSKKAETLSGGLKRRLNLAIALLNKPEILYLDEPTVGIDARSRQTILDAIAKMHSLGTTIVYTSHYMEEVETICDHIGIIDHGRLIAQDSKESFLQKANKQTLHITMAEPLPSYATDELTSRRAKLLSPREFVIEGLSPNLMTDVVKLVAELGGEIEQSQYGKTRLEDVYLDLLKLNEGK